MVGSGRGCHPNSLSSPSRWTWGPRTMRLAPATALGHTHPHDLPTSSTSTRYLVSWFPLRLPSLTQVHLWSRSCIPTPSRTKFRDMPLLDFPSGGPRGSIPISPHHCSPLPYYKVFFPKTAQQKPFSKFQFQTVRRELKSRLLMGKTKILTHFIMDEYFIFTCS